MPQLLIPHTVEERVRLRPGAVADIVSPAPRDIWRGVLRDDPGATALQTPEYLDAVVSATGGSDVSRFYQLRDGRQLVLPLVRRLSSLGPCRDAGYPRGYGNGGMLATGGLLADDVRAVVQDLRAQPLSLRIGGGPHTGEQWSAGVQPGVREDRRQVEVIEPEPAHAGDLAAFRAASYDVETRQALRRAARLGVEVEKDTTGRLLPVVQDVHRTWVERSVAHPGLPHLGARRWALRAEPNKKFTSLAAMTGDACRVFVAWYRGRPVAASIMLVRGQHAIGWRSYGVPELAAPVAAGLVSQLAGIEDAVSSGCRSIELEPGGSVSDLQHNHHKALGASPRSVVDLRIEPAGLARLRAARERAEGVLVRALPRSPDGSTLGQPKP